MSEPLPPLPLTDGAFLMDNSGFELLKCPRLWELQFLRRRVKADAKAGRNFGSTIHVGLAERYRRCSNNAPDPATIIAAKNEMRTWLDENPQPLEDFRSYDHACNMLDAYNEMYGNEPFRLLKNSRGEPLVENSFLLPIGEVEYPGFLSTKDPNIFDAPIIPIWLTGKLDLGIEDNSGEWIMDTKTAFQYGEGFDRQMQRDSGQKGYVWALQQILGRKPQGYIINAIRVRRSKRGDEYNSKPPIDASDFKRIPFYVSQDDLDTWRENLLAKVAMIFQFHANGYFPEYEGQCVGKYGLCDMYDVCSLSKAQREAALASSLYEPNTWTPLNKDKEKNEQPDQRKTN